MEHEDRHFGLEELASLIDIDLVKSTSGVQLPPDMQRHVEKCKECEQLIKELERSRLDLRSLRLGGTKISSSACLDEASLTELACGVLAPERAEALIVHIMECSSCGTAYREITEAVREEITDREAEAISTLAVSHAGQQRRLAKELTRIGEGSGPGAKLMAASRMRLWVSAAVAAMVGVVAVATWWYQYSTQHSPDSLIARAYAEQRTFELRFQNAPYAQVHRERDGGRSVFSKPETLLDAELSVKRKLMKTPNDPLLLDEKAKIDLLEWQYDEAISTLSAALNHRPRWPEALSDLAIAYTLRADQENRPLDYGTAVDLLGQALAIEPANPVFLFNKALVEEKLDLLESAMSDWQKYLAIDSKGKWADEAQGHLKTIQERLRTSQSVPAASSDAIVAIAALNPSFEPSTDLAARRGSRDEDYLDIAIQRWLPALAAKKLRGSDVIGTAEWRALNSLAGIMAAEHGDEWLKDVLSYAQSDQFAHGWIPLGAAASANEEGDFTAAATFAEQARRSFGATPKVAAALSLAEWEHAYAMQRSQRGTACLQDSLLGADLASSHRYPWITTQLLYERAVCAGMLADMSHPRTLIERALALAESAGYPNEELRGYHLRGIQSAAQDPNDAWVWFARGLQKHWKGPYRPFRVYHFYAEMAMTAESRDEWHLAQTLMSEAVTHICRTENHLTAAIAIEMLGSDTRVAGDPDRARAISDRADQLFASLRHSHATDDLRASIEVEQASILCQQSHWDSALFLLRTAAPHLSDQSQYRVWLQYYGALGEASLKTGNTAEAEKALSAAIQIGERSLISIRDERDRIEWENLTQAPYRALVQLELDKKHDAIQALDMWNWYKASLIRDHIPGTLQDINFAEYSSKPFSAPSVSKQLVANHVHDVTFISFAELDDELVGWVYDDHGIHEAQIRASPGDIRSATARFQVLCANPRSDLSEIRRLGAQLYQWLIMPFSDQFFPARTIVIGPDGPLQDLPFAALVEPHGTYFGQDYAVVICSGAALWSRLRVSDRFTPMDSALAVGFPYRDGDRRPSMPFLPEAYIEVSNVSKHFKGARTLLGNEVKVHTLERDLRGVRVFHFAGHSVVTDTISGLVMEPSDGGEEVPDSDLLDASQIERLPMQTVDLAVLSACYSVGRDSTGNSANSLVRPFIRAGVPHVVASHWAVDSALTVDFMNRFYDQLLAGAPPALALKGTYQAIASNPATAHPYYWAAFSLFGR